MEFLSAIYLLVNMFPILSILMIITLCIYFSMAFNAKTTEELVINIIPIVVAVLLIILILILSPQIHLSDGIH